MKMIKEIERRIEYIEITEERYNYVRTRFKYIDFNDGNKKHYYLAKNRLRLENTLE